MNLERARWCCANLAPSFVWNIAAYEVYYVRDREVVWRSHAIVGQPYRKTPIFRSEISYLVLNPTWTVPPTILANDILPAQKKDRGYLAKRGLRVIDSAGRTVPPRRLCQHQRARFRNDCQDPGPTTRSAALVHVPTPTRCISRHAEQALFEKSARASPGCSAGNRSICELCCRGQAAARARTDAAIAAREKNSTLAHPVRCCSILTS